MRDAIADDLSPHRQLQRQSTLQSAGLQKRSVLQNGQMYAGDRV